MVITLDTRIPGRLLPLFARMREITGVQNNVEISCPDRRLAGVAAGEMPCKLRIPLLLLRQRLEALSGIDDVCADDNVLFILGRNDAALRIRERSG